MTAKVVPPRRPQLPREEAALILDKHDIHEGVALLGIRGYYKNTLGIPGKNDRGIYDDAILLIARESYITFNANTDPSIRRPKVAVLQPGVWLYKMGIHGLSKPEAQRYKALVQAGPVCVLRDEASADTGWFGINIHRGGVRSTSSLGCQTVFPSQWDLFIAATEAELKRQNQRVIPYVLIEERENIY